MITTLRPTPKYQKLEKKGPLCKYSPVKLDKEKSQESKIDDTTNTTKETFEAINMNNGLENKIS